MTMDEWARTHARSDDPDTSKAAAARAAMRAGSIKAKIFDCLKENDPTPLSFEQIAKITGLREGQVWKRLSDLKNEGLIQPSGQTHKNESGADSIRWTLNLGPVQTVLL